MKNNKKNIFIILISVLILIVGILYTNFLLKQNLPQTGFKSLFIKEAPTNVNIKNTLTSLNVLGKSYSVKTEEGVSVYDVMKNAENDGFSFKGKEYPSLGFFVEEINGIKRDKGKYWIYSINGKESEIGVSKYVVKNGDIISWELK